MIATIRGIEFEVANEPADYWGWVEQGLYDWEWKAYEEHLNSGHVFVDLGAWIGSHSLYASTIAKLAIAVEPDPVAYRILAINKNAGMTIVNKAIAEGDSITLGSGLLGASTTRANPKAGSGIGAWEKGQTFEAKCTTLRELVRDLPDPLFVKIDIEGGEESLLKDFAFFAERKPTTLIELHPWWWRNNDAKKRFDSVAAIYRHVEHLDGDSWLLWN